MWRFLAGMFAVIGGVQALWLIHEIHTGIAITKFGKISYAQDPQAFWTEIVLGGLIIVFFFGCSYWFYRQERRRPKL